MTHRLIRAEQTDRLPCSQCTHYQAIIGQLQDRLQQLEDHIKSGIEMLSSVKSMILPSSFLYSIPNDTQPQSKRVVYTQSRRANGLLDLKKLVHPGYIENRVLELSSSDSGLVSYQYEESSDRINSRMEITEIRKKAREIEGGQEEREEREEQSMIEGRSLCHKVGRMLAQPSGYIFEVSSITDERNFRFVESVVTKTKGQVLTHLFSKSPIATTSKQRIGIKILKSREGYIYLGIQNEKQRKTNSPAAAQNKNMISYRAKGGKQLHVLNQEKRKVPQVVEGKCLSFEVDYEKGTMDWFVDKELVQSLQEIPFAGQHWYPFISLKHEEDSVELLKQ